MTKCRQHPAKKGISLRNYTFIRLPLKTEEVRVLKFSLNSKMKRWTKRRGNATSTVRPVWFHSSNDWHDKLDSWDGTRVDASPTIEHDRLLTDDDTRSPSNGYSVPYVCFTRAAQREEWPVTKTGLVRGRVLRPSTSKLEKRNWLLMQIWTRKTRSGRLGELTYTRGTVSSNDLARTYRRRAKTVVEFTLHRTFTNHIDSGQEAQKRQYVAVVLMSTDINVNPHWKLQFFTASTWTVDLGDPYKVTPASPSQFQLQTLQPADGSKIVLYQLSHFHRSPGQPDCKDLQDISESSKAIFMLQTPHKS